MRIGLYTFASLALIGLIAGLAYTVHPGNFVYEIAEINLNFPVALWIAIPMLILLMMTIFHMMYYSTKGYFARRKWVRDANELQDALYWSVLQEPKVHHFSVPEIKSGAALLSIASLKMLDSTEGLSDKLAKTINWVKKIEAGEYVDLKEKKVAKFLSAKNPLVVKNLLNRLEDNAEFAESILLAKGEYAGEVSAKALDIMTEKESFFKLRKFASLLGPANLIRLLERADQGEDVGFTSDNIEYFSHKIEMDCVLYMRLAQSSIKSLTPDENLTLFKQMAKEKEQAQNAYLYLLFQYEMLDEAKAYLEESGEDDFKPFRALYTLKKGKYNYRVSDIICSENICNGH